MSPSDSPLFRFRLTPLEKVAPWGTDGARTLHWVGLTDGQYWLAPGPDEWFRFSEAFLAPAGLNHTSDVEPYVDYHVARLHEDIRAMLPAIREPLPPDIAMLIVSPDDAERWERSMTSWFEEQPDDTREAWNEYCRATGWWDRRRLDTGYLTNPPRLHIWRTGATVHLRWDAREQHVDGVLVWEILFGEICLDVDRFLDEVASFHNHLMAVMTERVDAICASEPRPDVSIDREQLRAEHTHRRHEFVRARHAGAAQTDWADARRALALIGG